jgi:hypothetical protein
MMILLYILLGACLLAGLGWLIVTIGVGIASKEEDDDEF